MEKIETTYDVERGLIIKTHTQVWSDELRIDQVELQISQAKEQSDQQSQIASDLQSHLEAFNAEKAKIAAQIVLKVVIEDTPIASLPAESDTTAAVQ